jgi:hypothetical protein
LSQVRVVTTSSTRDSTNSMRATRDRMRNDAGPKAWPRGTMSNVGTTHLCSHADLMEPITSSDKATVSNVRTTRPRSHTDLMEPITSSNKATVSNVRTTHPRSHTDLTEPITSGNKATEGSRVTTVNSSRDLRATGYSRDTTASSNKGHRVTTANSSKGHRVTTASSNKGCRATGDTKIAAFRSSKDPASGDLATNMGDIGSPEVTMTASSNRGRRAMGDSGIHTRMSNGSRRRGTQRRTSR